MRRGSMEVSSTLPLTATPREIRLEDGAAIVAVSTDRDGDAVVAEVRDHY